MADPGHQAGDSAPPPPERPAPALVALCGQLFGSEQAPVRVVGLLPVATGCQDPLGLYLVDVARQYKTMVSVRIFDMKSQEARAVMARHNLRCAAVLVNERTRFDLGQQDGKVLLEGPMDPQDVRRALLFELKAACGESAPDLPPAPEDAPKPRRAAPQGGAGDERPKPKTGP